MYPKIYYSLGCCGIWPRIYYNLGCCRIYLRIYHDLSDYVTTRRRSSYGVYTLHNLTNDGNSELMSFFLVYYRTFCNVVAYDDGCGEAWRLCASGGGDAQPWWRGVKPGAYMPVVVVMYSRDGVGSSLEAVCQWWW